MKILVIGYVWPEADSSAAGRRTENILSWLQDSGCEIFFASPSKSNSYREKLEYRGIKTFSIAANDSDFCVLLKTLAPDACIFDRFIIEEQFGWQVQEVLPDAVRILDTQDLHFLRRLRQKKIERTPIPHQRDKDTLRELASIYRSDLTLIISKKEMEILTNDFGIPSEILHYLPLGYPPPVQANPFEVRTHLSMIGNFRHPPNTDGLKWFKNEIWPKIRVLDKTIEVHIFGAYPSKEIMQMDDPSSGFCIKGKSQDALKEISAYRINLAPLRYGAGIKGKILDGWWSGTPVVTTPIGAEGLLDPNQLFPGKVTTTAEDFAKETYSIYTSKEIWNTFHLAAIEKMAVEFDQNKIGKEFSRMIPILKKDLPASREKNLVGDILRYHRNMSTRYMSKWIQAKNSIPRHLTSKNESDLSV